MFDVNKTHIFYNNNTNTNTNNQLEIINKNTNNNVNQNNNLKNNNNLNLINNQKFTFSCIDYFKPFCILNKGGKYKSISFYKNFIYTDISIDLLIPLVERISKMKFDKENIKDDNQRFLSKMSSTVVINNYFKGKI